MASPALGVAILAAGASARMGQSKLLLPWKKTTVLGHIIALWEKLGAAQIAVVCAPSDEKIAAELERLAFPARGRIVNPEPARGMFSSIQCAASWTGWRARLTHYAIVLGDQPQVRTSTLGALVDFVMRHPGKICQPSRAGRARHPVFLPELALRRLAAQEGGTLRDFLNEMACDIRLLEIDDPGLDVDLDCPSDYAAAKSGRRI